MVHKVNYEKALTYDFGFGNSNTFAMFMYSAILCAYIAFWKRLNICFLFLIFLVSYIVYLYAFGRTVFVSELIFICSIVIAELGGRKILHKIKYWLALFPLFALVSFLFIIFNFQIMNSGGRGIFRLHPSNRFLGPVGQPAHIVQRYIKPITNHISIAEKRR